MATVMIVDNELFTVKIVKKILAAAGHKAVGASSAKECLEKVRAELPDLILMDIMMPEMSGWDAVKQIRADPNLKTVKILMLSAKQKEADQELLKLSQGFMTKPFMRNELLAKVDEMLSGPPP